MTEQYWKDIAYEHMPGGMVKLLADDTLTLLECNSKFFETTHLSPNEITGKGLLYYCDPSDRPSVLQSVALRAKEKADLHLEFRFNKKDGSTVWIHLAGSYTLADRTIPAYVCSLIDVSNFHTLQGQLRENVHALQAKQDEINELYHTVISGFAKIAVDEWYTLLFANDRLFELVGYTRFQVNTLFNNEIGRLIHPHDLESFRMTLTSMRGKGRFSMQLRLLHRGGDFVWIRLDGCFTDHFHHDVPIFSCFYTDINEQKKQETALHRQEYFTSLLSSSIAGGLAIFHSDPNRPLAYISESLLDLLGYSHQSLDEKTRGHMLRVVDPLDLDRIKREFELQCHQKEGYELEFRVKKSDGSLIWLLEKGRETTDENGEIIYVSMYMDITERKNRTDALFHQSTHDSLTKLYNRFYTRQCIETYLKTRSDHHSSALFLLDLDNFKHVNDLYGHLEGDFLLASIGQLLQTTFLSKDIIGRMGGDEFLVFLTDVQSEYMLTTKAQNICNAIKNFNPTKYPGLSVSVGIVHIVDEPITYDQLVQTADFAMYQAKFSGKNSWYLHHGSINMKPQEPDYRQPMLLPADEGTHAFDFMANSLWILSNVCDGLAVVDLTTGLYTKMMFNESSNFGTPTCGDYSKTFPTLVSQDIFPADQQTLWNMGELDHLKEAYSKGIKKETCHYRRCLDDGSLRWMEERYYFTVQNQTPMAFSLMRTMEEQEKELLTKNMLSAYESALLHTFTTKLEINLSQNQYTLLQNEDPNFVPMPEHGTLQVLTSIFSGAVHPMYHDRCCHYVHLHPDHPLYREDTGPIIENILFRMADDCYHHLCCIVIPFLSPDGDHLLFLSMTDAEKRHDLLFADDAMALKRQFSDSERYHLALQQSGLTVFDWNTKERTLYHTPNSHHFLFLDFPPDQLTFKMSQGHGTHPEDWKLLQRFFNDVLYSTCDTTEITLRLACHEDSFLWCKIVASITRSNSGMVQRLLGTITDVNEAILSKKQLEYKEQHDPLTGLYNYSHYQDRVTDELRHTHAKHFLSFSDIKNFKYINDIYGYEVGDRMLQFIANALNEFILADAIAGRLSADRISILCKYANRADIEHAFNHYAARLLTYRDSTTMQAVKIEVAFGFYCIDDPTDIAPFQEMINRAHIAEKSVKELTGSRCAFYSRELRDRVLQEKEWEFSLLDALEKEQFEVYLQPQVSIQNDLQTFGGEALVRWKQSDGTLIAPGEFIPLFEKTGGIRHLDCYVFESVCRYVQKRIQDGKPQYQISVNVSHITMMDPLFTSKYGKLKDQYHIPDGLLVLECTETSIIEDIAQFQIILQELRSHGFLVAMDDFGTGYSSLNLLKNIDIDILKLDMGFFRGQTNPLKDDAIISGIFNIAKALHLYTLAEGIESMTLVEMLRHYGCDSIQGYVFSKPRPMEEFDDAISEIIAEAAKTSAHKEETTDTKTID